MENFSQPADENGHVLLPGMVVQEIKEKFTFKVKIIEN